MARAVLILGLACYNANPQSCQIQCDVINGSCPDGLQCFQNSCVAPGFAGKCPKLDAGVDVMVIDAMVDAPMIDAKTNCPPPPIKLTCMAGVPDPPTSPDDMAPCMFECETPSTGSDADVFTGTGSNWHPAAILDPGANTLAKGIVMQAGSDAWIGLRRDQGSNAFQWTDPNLTGMPVMDFWAPPGEPGGTNELCALQTGSGWVGAPCTDSHFFLTTQRPL